MKVCVGFYFNSLLTLILSRYAQQNFTTLEMLKRVYHLIIDLVLLRFYIVDLYFWLVNLCYQTESKIGEKCTDSVILDINMGSENNRWFFWAWNFLKQFWNMCLGRIISMWLINQDSISNFTFYLHTFTFWQKNGISENEIPQKFHNYKVYSCVHSWNEN